MADRTERVILTAQISNYLAGMEKARQATDKTATAAQKLAAQREAMNGLGLGMLGLGTAFSAGLLLAISKTAEFNQKMSQVKTLSHATVDEMSSLSDAALHLGQSIGFSASEVGDAEIELVKAGVSVKDQLGGGLVGTLNLAAAGQLDVADATQIAASAMTQFGLAGKDVPHIADLLAAGADKALGSVQDLGNGLKFVGPVAKSMGISIEQTVGTLALFAQNGILGEQAGTGLRGVLLSLTSPSKLASDVMKEYGINLYDAQGKFIGLAGTAQQLQKGLGGLDEATRNQALGQIFGNAQITEATILMNGGAKAVDKWTKSVNDNGFAAEQAAGKMDNLQGDLAKLRAAWETDVIQAGGGANAVLRDTVQGFTALARAGGDVPKPLAELGLGFGGVTAAMLLAGGTALTAVTKFGQLKEAIETLKISVRGVGFAAGGVAAGVGILVTALGVMAEAQAKSQAHVDELSESLDQQTSSITKNTRAIVAKSLQDSGAFTAAKRLGISVEDVTSAALGQEDATKRVNEQLALQRAKVTDAANAMAQHGKLTGFNTTEQGKNGLAIQAVAEALGFESSSVKKAIADSKELASATDQSSTAQDGSARSSKSAAQAYLDAADSAGNLTSQISQLIDQVNKANGVGQDAVSTNADYRKAIDDATQSVKDYVSQHGRSAKALDESTSAGSANVEMLADLAKRGQSAAEAQFNLDGNTDAYIQRLKDTRNDVIQRATDLGGQADQVQNLADKVAALPTDKEVQVIAQTGAATQAVQAYKDFLASLPATMTTRFDAKFNADARGSGGYATGGRVVGPGTATSDSIPARLSNGEYVVNAAAAARNLPTLDAMNYGRRYAEGGYVTPRYVPATAGPPTVMISSANLEKLASRTGSSTTVEVIAPPIADPYVLGAVIGREVRRGIK